MTSKDRQSLCEAIDELAAARGALAVIFYRKEKGEIDEADEEAIEACGRVTECKQKLERAISRISTD